MHNLEDFLTYPVVHFWVTEPKINLLSNVPVYLGDKITYEGKVFVIRSYHTFATGEGNSGTIAPDNLLKHGVVDGISTWYVFNIEEQAVTCEK